MITRFEEWAIPENKITQCKMCYLADNTGYCIDGKRHSADLDSNIHEGFSIGKGKTLYWMIIWHRSGHCTVYNRVSGAPRHVNGDTPITIHFK